MSTELVSVVIPTYNRAEFIGGAINSVLEQTYDHHEIIVIDDGSTDRTQEVVESFEDNRIQYIYQENSGANVARNNGIDASYGQYISFLDSDDEFDKHYLSTTIESMQNAPEHCVGVATSFSTTGLKNRDRVINYTPDKFITYQDIIRGNPIGSLSATTFKRDVLLEVDGFDECLPAAQDYDLYVRILASGYTIKGHPAVLVRKHDTEGNISSDIDRKRVAFEMLLEKYGDDLTSSRVADHHYMLGFLNADKGDIDSAAEEFKKSIQVGGLQPLYIFHYLSAKMGLEAFRYSLSVKKAVNRAVYSLRT